MGVLRVRTGVNDRHAGHSRKAIRARVGEAFNVERARAPLSRFVRSLSSGARGNKRSELIVRRISSFADRYLAVQYRNRRRRRRWRQCGVRNQKSDGDLNGFRVAGPIPYLVEWIGGSFIVPASARIFLVPFLRRREERLVPFPLYPTFRRENRARDTQKPSRYALFSIARPLFEMDPNVAGHFVNLSPGFRGCERNERKSSLLSFPQPSLEIDRDPAVFHSGMSPSRRAFRFLRA